jgi:sec-independent protein translocase protein TatC
MVFLIGLLFEFPTIVMVLSHLGLLTRKQLRGFRKSAFVVILILAAFITPSDPFSMFVLAIPLYGLYEFSILVCKHDTPADDDLAE